MAPEPRAMPPAWERSAANTSGCTIRLQVNRRPSIRTSPRVVRFCENGLASHSRFSRATNRIAGILGHGVRADHEPAFVAPQ